MYHYAIPAMDRSLPIKRALFQDMTVDDAVTAAGFGWGELSKADVDAKRDLISRANHDADVIVSFGSFVADSMHAQYGIAKSKVFAIGGGPMRRCADGTNLSRPISNATSSGTSSSVGVRGSAREAPC